MQDTVAYLEVIRLIGTGVEFLRPIKREARERIPNMRRAEKYLVYIVNANDTLHHFEAFAPGSEGMLHFNSWMQQYERTVPTSDRMIATAIVLPCDFAWKSDLYVQNARGDLKEILQRYLKREDDRMACDSAEEG